jgi:hypothetical protein
MVGLRGESIDGVVAQARSQALEKTRPVLGVAGRVAEHGAARAGKRREVAGFEHDCLHRPPQRHLAQALA